MDSQVQKRKAQRREQEAQQRRQEILLAARELFIQKGFANTTLDEIADQSAFGKGTIYNYFASKEELFHAIVEQLLEEDFEAAREAMTHAPQNARAQFQAYAAAVIKQFQKNDDVMVMLSREHHQFDHKVIERLAERVKRHLAILIQPLEADMRAGRAKAGDANTLATLFGGMVRTHCLIRAQGLWPEASPDAEMVAQLLVAVFFDGIAIQPE